MIRFACPKCKATIQAPDNKVGAKAPCPKCGQRLQVPAPPASKTLLGEALPASQAPAGKTVVGDMVFNSPSLEVEEAAESQQPEPATEIQLPVPAPANPFDFDNPVQETSPVEEDG